MGIHFLGIHDQGWANYLIPSTMTFIIIHRIIYHFQVTKLQKMVEVVDKDDNKKVFQTPLGTLKESSLEDEVIYVLVEGIVHKLFFHYYSTLSTVGPYVKKAERNILQTN